MPRLRNTPVIVMTASINPNDFEACRDLNVVSFIPKPVTFALFSDAIIRLPHLPAFTFAKPNPVVGLNPD
jgi:CheY-like chemotaxis protein